MTLLTLTYSRNDLKLFWMIVRTDLLLLLYGAPGRFVERRLTNLSLYLYFLQVVVLYPYTKFEVRRPCRSEDMVHDVCEH